MPANGKNIMGLMAQESSLACTINDLGYAQKIHRAGGDSMEEEEGKCLNES